MNRTVSDPRQATTSNHTESRDESRSFDPRTMANPRVTSTDFKPLPFEQQALDKPRYDSFTCSLKCYGKDFDRTMPYALKDRLSKDEFRSHVEKINGMMRERPRELEGYARECDRKRRAWATAAILTDIVVFVSAVCFLCAFIAFGIVLGFAVGDITPESWWWAVVLTAALWAFCCFVLTISTIVAVYCHQKWRTWTKVTRDESTLEKYHAIIRYLRRENDRYFHSKGVSFELNIERGLPRQHYAGWSMHHHPTLDVHVYHKAFVIEPAVEKTITQNGNHITESSRPVSVMRKAIPNISGTSSRQAQAQDEATGVMQSFDRSVDREGVDDDAIVA